MRSGNKGIVFSLDAAIAVSVVIIILINSSYYFSTSSKESLSQLQLVKIGNDVVTALENNGQLNSYGFNQLYNASGMSTLFINSTILGVYSYLPKNYEMGITIYNIVNFLTSSITVGPTCGGDGCVFDEAGDYYSMNTPSVDKEGNYTFRVYLAVVNVTQKFSLTVEATNVNITNLSITGILVKDYYYFNKTVNLSVGVHNITFSTPESPVSVLLVGYSILGENSFAKSTPGSPPVDRFTGAGERFFAIKNLTSNINEMALLRYTIWLK